MIGIGNENAAIHFYIENRPPLEQYQLITETILLAPGDIANIATLTGNHWRKIFNVMAKLAFELNTCQFSTWQALRDNSLLQEGSEYCLYFSAPKFNELTQDKVHIVLGKTYATKLGMAEQCHWLTPTFAINEKEQIVICPYFDYRQLSNIKITQLVQLIKGLTR